MTGSELKEYFDKIGIPCQIGFDDEHENHVYSTGKDIFIIDCNPPYFRVQALGTNMHFTQTKNPHELVGYLYELKLI